MLKEETMVIKESLQDSSLDQFCASDGWLYTWKSAFAIKESRIVGEAFVLQMGGYIHGKVLSQLKKVELLVRLQMLQKKKLHPGLKEFRN